MLPKPTLAYLPPTLMRSRCKNPLLFSKRGIHQKRKEKKTSKKYLENFTCRPSNKNPFIFYIRKILHCCFYQGQKLKAKPKVKSGCKSSSQLQAH
jgi:hypothetical protein